MIHVIFLLITSFYFEFDKKQRKMNVHLPKDRT